MSTITALSTPPDKRCGCNMAAAETSTLALSDDVLSECVACGAVWSLADGVPPNYIAWLAKMHLDVKGIVGWTMALHLADAELSKMSESSATPEQITEEK